MATPFQNVYNSFLQKVKNYTYANLSTTDLTSLLSGFLQSAIPHFQYYCINDLTQYDSTLGQFTADLLPDEIEILSTCMVLEYLKGEIYREELLKQGFTNREWSRTSQANHLIGLLDLKSNTEKDIDTMIVKYTYNRTDLSQLQ